MNIDKYKNQNGYYQKDDDSPEYESPLDFIGEIFLYSCGCGYPEEYYKYVLEVLNILYLRRNVLDDKMFKDSYVALDKFFKSGGEKIFVLYHLDKMGLTEHGGSVLGCWLTPLGLELREDLELLLKNEL